MEIRGNPLNSKHCWKRWQIAWGVLVIGLMITAFSTLHIKKNLKRIEGREFASHCDEIRKMISNGLDKQSHILMSCAAFINASEMVTREEWRSFSNYHEFEEHLPGTQGICFSILISRAELARHIQQMRGEGFPGYNIKPGGDREIYSSVIHFEPSSAHNLNMFGYDMLTEPLCRDVMEQAKDTGKPALSSKVIMPQEHDGEDFQTCYMMYPVYRKGMPVDSVEQRRAAIYGWVFSHYKIKEMIQGLLVDGNLEDKKISLKIFDGENPSPGKMIFENSLPDNGRLPSEVRFSRQIPLDSNGHKWTLLFAKIDIDAFETEEMQIWLVLIGGILISFLGFFLVRALLHSGVKAQQMAEELTNDLQKEEEKFSAIANYTVDWETWYGIDGRILWMNPAVERITGYSVLEIMEMPDLCSTLIAEEDRDLFREVQRSILARGHGDNFELRYVHKNGSKLWLGLSWQPIFDKKGNPLGVRVSGREITARKLLEENLKSSEENFRMFFQAADDIIVVSSPDGHILFANEVLSQKLGYAAEELKDMRITDMHPEEYRKEAETILASMLRKERKSCQFPLKTKDGMHLPVETRLSFGRWNGVECIFSISRDLSVQQSALDKFEKMFRRNPALMSLNSFPDERFVDANDVFLNKLGYTLEDVMGKTPEELNFLADPKMKDKISGELKSHGQSKGVELKLLSKNGDCVDVLFSGEIINNNGQQAIMAAMVDLSAQKQAEATLIHTSEMKKLLMELSSQYINVPLDKIDAAIQLSLEIIGNFVSADRAYVFSYDFERQITCNEYEWCNTDVEPQIDNLKEVPLAPMADWVALHLEGNYIYIEDVSALPQGWFKEFLEPQGIKSLLVVPMMSGSQCIGFVGFDSVKKRHIFTDKEISLLTLFSQMLVNVKSRAKMELDLIETNRKLNVANTREKELSEQARMASSAKSRFLAHMSHEIRTPLNAILGFCQLLQRDPELTSKQKQRVDTINRSGEHLLALLNDILELSKIESGSLTIAPTAFDLHSLLNDILLLFQTQMEHKNLTMNTAGLDKVPRYLFTDKQKLRQMIINLLTNAVKYTETGGICLRVSVEHDDAHGMHLVVQVEDSGPGIAAEEMKRLFTAFEQTSTGRKSGSGSGLGLSISRQFARAMGGDVTATSELGKGSTFRIEIPVKEGKEYVKDDVREVLRLETGQPRCSILVAEDDDDSRLFLVQMLDNIGFEVFEVSDGREAITAFTNKHPQLILIDYSMPEMKGDEAIRQIRKSPGGTSVKIILITANASDEMRQIALASGSDDLMAKPFRCGELFEKIRMLSGVRYVYADTPLLEREAADSDSASALTRNMMESLPSELRRQIRTAAISCRHEQLLELVQDVAEISPEIGEKLRGMVMKFDYSTLI